MDMIERIARAMFHAECEPHKATTGYGDTFGWDDAMPSVRERLTKNARAAIEAMKLTDAAEGVPGGIAFEDAFFGEQTTVFHATRDAWNATIDAMLAPSPPSREE